MDLLRLWHDYRFYLCVGLSVVILAFKISCKGKRNSSKKPCYMSTDEKCSSLIPTQRSRLHQQHDSSLPSQAKISRNKLNSENFQAARKPLKRIIGKRDPKKRSTKSSLEEVFLIQPVVMFYSLSGNTEQLALEFSDKMVTGVQNKLRKLLKPYVLDLSRIEYDDYFCSLPRNDLGGGNPKTPIKFFYIILVPTYNIDTMLDTFLERLQEIHYDFRIDTAPLSEILAYSVLGFGDKREWPTEELGFCSQAQEVDKWLGLLTGGKRAYPLGRVDISHDEVSSQMQGWRQGVEQVLIQIVHGSLPAWNIAKYDEVIGSDEDENEFRIRNKSKARGQRTRKEISDDLEDLKVNDYHPLNSSTSTRMVGFSPYRKSSAKAMDENLKEMVPQSSPTYAALTKQGYHIVGSHSASKTCRWTKSALRGRGSCYKYSFYGIKSHLCMEATPSLSCSNKCVFCWRHGTNPVGTTWRWQVDPPDLVFSGIKEGHYRKIKEMRGIPGVRAERLEEALTIRHCALSLVGEPIFYPHINALVSMLHEERISTFLVCNAQHPDQLQALQRVTQLYVSIDASNRESLRKIDRPLHRDFWERFSRCLDILREKRFHQRTVFRLTLVKGFNVENEAEGYADLVSRGLPCFIEVKGVTYCGTSTSASAGLTMQNVPFYDEVKEFVESLNIALAKRGLAYDVAAEHAHSCCILIASKRFLVDQVWHTSIDYERFFECLRGGSDFAPEDYMAPTPEFALFGNGGFNPEDERVFRKRKV